MADYWISFRIHDNAGYQARYQNFHEAIDEATVDFWAETTSFYLARSPKPLNDFVRYITRPLTPMDIVVVRELGRQDARYFGAVERLSLLLDFMPYAKKLQ